MKKMLILSQLAMVAAMSAFAADAPLYVKGHMLVPQADLKEITQNTWGYGFEAGVRFFENDGFRFQIHGQHVRVSQKDKVGLPTYAANATFMGVDASYDLGKTGASIFTGPVVGSWNIADEKPAKMGWRVGVEYGFMKSWIVDASYTFTEWKSVTGDPQTRLNSVKPSFFKIGVGYRFGL